MRIELVQDRPVIPKKVYKARQLPAHWEAEAKATVANLVADGVLEEVFDLTTDWVSPSFFVAKEGGKVRLVTDFTHLNRFVKRPVHPFPSAQEIVQSIPPGTRYFAKLDAVKGYHQGPGAPDGTPLQRQVWRSTGSPGVWTARSLGHWETGGLAS